MHFSSTKQLPKRSEYALSIFPHFHISTLIQMYKFVNIVNSVAYTDRRSCASQRQVILNNTVGYISSTITRDYGIGSTQCPWKIQVKAGQRIRLSVFNLARSNEALPNYEDLSNERRQDVCYEFAMLKEEGGHMRSLTSCNGEERINIVYTTESNAVTIEFVNPNILDTLDTFLMKYEGMYMFIFCLPPVGIHQQSLNNIVHLQQLLTLKHCFL